MRADELKQKICSAMFSHLRERGYPNMTDEQIMAELPALWRRLEAENLLPNGARYADFVEKAIEGCMQEKMVAMQFGDEEFEEFFRVSMAGSRSSNE